MALLLQLSILPKLLALSMVREEERRVNILNGVGATVTEPGLEGGAFAVVVRRRAENGQSFPAGVAVVMNGDPFVAPGNHALQCMRRRSLPELEAGAVASPTTIDLPVLFATTEAVVPRPAAIEGHGVSGCPGVVAIIRV